MWSVDRAVGKILVVVVALTVIVLGSWAWSCDAAAAAARAPKGRRKPVVTQGVDTPTLYYILGGIVGFSAAVILWRFCRKRIEEIVEVGEKVIECLKSVCPFLVMTLIIFFISGHVYNHITGSPWAYMDRHDNIYVIARSHNQQLIGESLAVFFLYGFIVYNFIKLIEVGEEIQEKKSKSHSASEISKHGFFIAIGFTLLINMTAVKG